MEAPPPQIERGPPPSVPPRLSNLGAGTAAGRPTGVTVLAVLYAVSGVAALFAALGLFAVGSPAQPLLLGAVFLLLYGLAAFVVAWGLWNRLVWAWYTAVVLAVVGLVFNLVGLFAGEIASNLFGLVLGGVILWYLFRPEVQAWFGAHVRVPWGYPGRPA